MVEENLRVGNNIVVSLDYVLTLDDEKEIDRSEENEPLEYLHSFNNIIPGLEKELVGLEIGDEKQVIVQPEQGYGERDPNSVADYERSVFPSSRELEIGTPIMMRDKESGESFQAYVAELDDESVRLDFNHPLAGETLYFKVRIAGLREPTGDEIAHGHVHQPGHNH